MKCGRESAICAVAGLLNNFKPQNADFDLRIEQGVKSLRINFTATPCCWYE
jgi:hypothetical protein